MPRVPAISRDAFLKWADARWTRLPAVPGGGFEVARWATGPEQHPEQFVVAYQTKRRDQVRLAVQGTNRELAAPMTAEVYRDFQKANPGIVAPAQPQQRRNHESAGTRHGARPNDRTGRSGREWGR